ncbi:shikimate dehydrogenase [Halalkalibacter urbisdiaboli]|uniref:shikimate dehydrogenase n=1 Tax=Halalkalibacter urbisdiaboli TaxID=1960589 RepID=UPI000B446E1D|nr:shikimate dehydrogenase [Halalkalibacter urbisdiaboli]
MEKLFGLFGHPVQHSMSPMMHNDAFAQLGINASYRLFNVEPKFLKDAVSGIRGLNIAGCNVTIPHKVSVMDYLDEIDEEAKTIGAVNTIVNDDGKLIGYNTDGRGYFESLLSVLSRPLEQHKVLVIGAGGAARAIVTVLAKEKAEEIVIANRTVEKAEELANVIEGVKATSIKNAEQTLDAFDIVINTTSVGMSPNIEEIPLSLEKLRQDSVVSDLIYNPINTRLLQEAAQKGANTLNGVGMFVNQGALSFEYWTGQKPNRERMAQLVYEKLGGKSC